MNTKLSPLATAFGRVFMEQFKNRGLPVSDSRVTTTFGAMIDNLVWWADSAMRNKHPDIQTQDKLSVKFSRFSAALTVRLDMIAAQETPDWSAVTDRDAAIAATHFKDGVILAVLNASGDTPPTGRRQTQTGNTLRLVKE